ncbi:WbqC family protein [Lentimicrobium sp.]
MPQSGNIISIHQPNYIPWLGYFYKIYQSDVFVFLDDVQFSNQGMHNYHYIKTPQGPFRLKIPVLKHFKDNINQVKINDAINWRQKHLKTIETNYKRSVNFEEVYTDLKDLLFNDYPDIAVLNSTMIAFFCQKLGISTRFISSSELNITSSREQKIIDICIALDGVVYYSGTGAKAYQDENNFLNHGLELRYSSFNAFEYPQLWGDFQSNVTIIDYLMNCGYNWDKVVSHQK